MHFTSCATFPQSALRKGGATGKVRHATLNKHIGFLEGAHPIAAELIWGSTPGRPQVVNSAAIG